MSELTQSDKNMIYYFITEKADITRWCDYEKKKGAIKEQFPVLYNLLDAKKELDMAIELYMEKFSMNEVD